jgi:hypothetical protein
VLPWSDRFANALVRYRLWLFALLAAFYVGGFNGQWLIGPDSALYLCLGRNVALGRGYTYQGSPQWLAYPGLPYALAAVFFLFGSKAIVAANALILLCGVAVIALTYRLFLLTFDRPTATVVTLGLGATYEFYRYCYEILTDVPFAMGVMAVLAGHAAIFDRSAFSRRKPHWYDWLLLGGGLIIAICTRPTMIGLFAALMGVIIWSALRRGDSRRLLLGGAGLGIAALLLFLAVDPRASHAGPASYESWALDHVTRDLAHRLRYDMWNNVKDLFGASAARSVFGVQLGTWWLNTLFGIVVLASGLSLITIRPLWGAWVAITIVMMIVLISHDRYLVEILPLLVGGWWRVLQAVNRRFGNLAFALLLPLGILPNCAKLGAMAYNQHRQPFLSYYKDGKLAAYSQIARAVTDADTDDQPVLASTKVARVMTFLTDRRVVEAGDYYGGPPDEKLLVLLDPADAQMRQWLSDLHITTDSPPLASVPQMGGKSPVPPLLLLRGRHQ